MVMSFTIISNILGGKYRKILFRGVSFKVNIHDTYQLNCGVRAISSLRMLWLKLTSRFLMLFKSHS